MISYSPLHGNDLVSNASLLGSKVLAYCYKYTKNEKYLNIARSSVRACCKGQSEDGSWTYSQIPPKLWVDSFHTGYNLDGLIAYENQSTKIQEPIVHIISRISSMMTEVLNIITISNIR